jgi:hypothetical protein
VRFVILLLAGCVAIRPPELHERPLWRITGNDMLDADCVIARAFVRKSGKQGIGMAVQLHSRTDCTFAPTSIALVFADGSTQSLPLPPPTLLHGRSLLYAWYPLAFDNNAAWNAGKHDATLALAYTAGTRTGTWTIGMHEQ